MRDQPRAWSWALGREHGAGKNWCIIETGKPTLSQVYGSKFGVGIFFFSGGLTENAQPWGGPRCIRCGSKHLFLLQKG